MRVTFVISSLSAGGAEKVASVLANHWVQVGHRVTFITIDSIASDFYSLDSNIFRMALGLNSESHDWREFLVKNLVRTRRLRRAILGCAPDVVVSFMDATNVMVLLATLGSGVPVVVSERIDPRKKPLGAVLRLLRCALYPLAQAVVVQTRNVALWAHEITGKDRVFVIPNAVARPACGRCRPVSTRNCTVLAMGRLDPQKGFDLLLEAFARCLNKHPEWALRIIGDGPERERLIALTATLGIASRVRIDAVTAEPGAVFRQADLFVLSSRYEGFPNALLEAMAFGLPVISFDCPSGPAEIIRHSVDGVLVPPENVVALEGAMDRLMGSEHDRRRLGARATEVVKRFGFAEVIPMWDALLAQVTA